MATIEERIKNYTPLEEGSMDSFTHEQSAKITAWIDEAYRDGATEQRKIDIDKACEWWTEYLDYPTYIEEDRARIKEMVEDFRKAMTDER